MVFTGDFVVEGIAVVLEQMGEEERTVAAIEGWLFARPSPYRDEEELKYLLVIHQIGYSAASDASPRRFLQHLPGLQL